MSALLKLLLALVLTGCAVPSAAPRAGQPQAPAPDAGANVTVVATVYPLAWLAEQVAPAAEVTQLGARGRDPHDLELSPADRALFESADVVVYIGDIGFQPQVEEAVRASSGQVVSAAEVAGPQRLREFGHGRADGGGEAAGEDDHAPDEHRTIDPHLWFDPTIMADLAERLGEAFAAADPDRADDYRANARAVREQFLALRAEFERLLGDCAFDEVVVSHEAYAYLLAPHDLGQEGVSGAGGHAEASPQRVAELVRRVREEGFPAVLVEPVEGRSGAEAVAAETGVELIDIYSLDIVSDEQAERGLVQLLREQAGAVARAARCA